MILSDLPILHEGRIKPLESFAVLYLKAFKDTLYVDNEQAMAWFLDAMFDPTTASTQEIFYISHRDTLAYLNMPASRDDAGYKKHVSLSDLITALSPHQKIIEQLKRVDTKTHTHVQAELVRLHNHASDFNDILQSFSMLLPIASFDGHGMVTYRDMQAERQDLMKDIEALIDKKGDNIERYTTVEQEKARLAYQLQIIEQSAGASNLLKIMPSLQDTRGDGTTLVNLYDDYLWQTPWNIKGPDVTLEKWSEIIGAYYNQDAEMFNKSAQALRTHVFNNENIATKQSRFHAEIFYNGYRPLLSAMVLYGIVLLLMITGFYYRQREKKPYISAINNAVFFTTALALFSHGLGIALRMIIMQRPPVTSLYETMLFVSLVLSLVAFILFLKRKDMAVLGVSIAAALMILIFSATFLVGQDSMHMLVAVLNTNFWLTTHVIIITAGYGFCVLAAMVAHLYLVRSLIPSMRHLSPQSFQDIKQDRLSFLIYLFSLIALLLTAVGTILGGVWADQSWGRFWGWDPKENGALLIVLWLIWLLHGRLSGHLSHLWFVLGTAFLNVIVAIAWFGVNLLNVGLHSYGFISGIADGLFIFCVSQIFILISLTVLHKRNVTKAPK